VAGFSLHNELRNRHENTPPLTWDPVIAAAAQEWADYLAFSNNCQLEHNRNDNYGENLAYNNPSLEHAVDLWYTPEKAIYDSYLRNGDGHRFYMDTGHYTQVVWVGTERVGCGVQQCNSGNRSGRVWVCQYASPGNVNNRFPENVMPLK
jgi:uncharacterized protein YkwD